MGIPHRRAWVVVLVGGLASPTFAAGRGPQPAWCGTRPDAVRDATWSHREAEARRGLRATSAGARDEDLGQIAVLYDEGDLALPRNPMDLAGDSVRFLPVGNGYRLERAGGPALDATGERLVLGDDDSTQVALPFAFPFYGQPHDSVFVNSDGNLTFGEPDSASTARSLGRFVSGPPRIAPLFADFDPTSGGQVTTRSTADGFTVSWSGVPQWDHSDSNTFEVTLRPDGSVELGWAEDVSADIEEGVVGIAPGAERDGLAGVDMSTATDASGTGAIAEGFRADDDIDTLAVARRFFGSHADAFTQLVVFTNRSLIARGTFAYEQTVLNDVSGIGDALFDYSRDYGSAGALESFVYMDDISKYPQTLSRPFLGEDSALAVLAHETGHRWLAQATFRDADGRDSHELLGRDGVHWSFFLDTDASHLEGNDIADLGGGGFQTTAAGQRYSPLDLYLMGVRVPGDVPPLFFVRDPQGAGSDPGRDPQSGVLFSGTRVDVSVDDVIASLGPRDPAAGSAPLVLHQAFVLVVVGDADPAEVGRVEQFRAEWEAFFATSSEGRVQLTTTLAP